jgi:hypothetical protein
MRFDRISRLLLAAGACAFVITAASEVCAQTQQLNKTLERKFPEGDCPLDTSLLGTFITNTGIIQLTFATRDEDNDPATVAFNQILDDISIIESAEFFANSIEDPDNCYFDGPPYALEYQGSLDNNPKVPFHDGFGPSTSPCAWDETDGAAIQNGVLQFVGGSGDGVSTTSVIISGLTPGTQYVIHGRWSAEGFLLPDACGADQACLEVTVDDLEEGCVTLPVQSTTWGKVKALYKN